MESDKLIGKLATWALLLQDYDFEVVHRAGITNLDANGLSRNPSPSNEDLTGARWHRHSGIARMICYYKYGQMGQGKLFLGQIKGPLWCDKCTHSMLRGQYWWVSMYLYVVAYVGRCGVCHRVRYNFNTLSPQLQPLLIMGLGYSWSLDFAGPLVVTPRGAKCVLVVMEHFSKWIELVALPQNSAELAAAAFLNCVLAHFGALAEVLTDQRRGFLGVFEELCTKALIDHRTISRDHPKADGFAERVVQTTKRGLRKYKLLQGNHRDWDLMLPWISMGYQFSRHASPAS